MKQRMLYGIFIVLIAMVHQLLALDTKKSRVAVFWNNGSSIVPYETPVGYAVGSGADGTSAPEIGKSGLKLFLTSLDPAVGYDGTTTLDTSSIKESVRDNSGVLTSGSTPVLPNVRIYSVGSDVSFSDIKADFGGELPDVITVINSGGSIYNDDLKQVLYDASLAEVGVLLIGSASTSFAVAIDELAVKNGKEKFFAVKGIQKAFNVESYKGSLLFDFDLTGDSKPDSVVLEYDGTTHAIKSISGVTYQSSTDSYTYTTGTAIYTQGGASSLNAGITVQTSYGQFVIANAKAQSVIEYDSYDPAMNSGIFYDGAVLAMNGSNQLITTQQITADTIPSASSSDKKTIPVNGVIQEAGTAAPFGTNVPRAWMRSKNGASYGSSISYKATESITVPGAELYGGGTSYIETSSTSTEFHMYAPSKNGGNAVTDATGFYKSTNAKYPEVVADGGLYKVKANDTVFVWSLKGLAWERDQLLGSFIVDSVKNAPEGYRFTFANDFIINNKKMWEKGETFDFVSGYEMKYPAKGYDSLSIDIKGIAANGNAEIFDQIFTKGDSKLTGTDSVMLFKPWAKNGRIQAAAEIWAVDTAGGKVAKFNDWYKAGGTFDSTKYYFGRFGQQIARGNDQFSYLVENSGNFTKTKFDRLPDASIPAFADKEYYALSVIQKNHQRLAIVGYEPQYLANATLSKNVIRDLFSWTAVDDSRMPTATVQMGIKDAAGNIYDKGDTIPTSVNEIRVIIDYSDKSDAFYAVGATVTGTLKQGTTAVAVDWANPVKKTNGAKIDTLIFPITGPISAVSGASTALTLTNVQITGAAPTPGKVDTAAYTFQKLKAPASTNKALPVSGKDTLRVSTDMANKAVTGVAITYRKNGGADQTGSSPLEIAVAKDDSIAFTASKDGYIASDLASFKYTSDAPFIKSAIPDVSIKEDAADSTIKDLDDVFGNGNGSTLTYKVKSLDSALVIGKLNADNKLILDVQPNKTGSTKVVVTANDGTTSIDDTVDVVVTPVNDDPVVNKKISDMVVLKDSTSAKVADLDTIFSDVDGDKLTFTVESQDSSIAVGKLDANNLLTIDIKGKVGKTIVIVTARDSTISVKDTFEVDVRAENKTPTVKTAIPNLSIKEDAADSAIADLDDVFTDPDGDKLTYTVKSLDSTLAIGKLDADNKLIVDVQPNKFGSTKVIVSATDGQFTVHDTVDVTVTPENDTPIITTPIKDVEIKADSKDSTVIDLDDVFDDLDGDNLTYTVKSLDSLLAIGKLDPQNKLIVEVKPGKTGATKVIVTASDGKSSTSDTVDVVVGNKIPVVNKTINDIIIKQDANDSTIIDLDNVITDPDGDKVTFTVKSLDSVLVIGKLDSDNKLIIDVQPGKTGKTKVIVTATDGTGSISDTVEVTVENITPVVTKKIDDIVTKVDSKDSTIVDLDDIFDDSSTDTLTYVVKSLDSTLVIGKLDVDNKLIIDVQPGKTGKTKIIVTASDKKTTVSDTVDVTITDNSNPKVDTVVKVTIDTIVVKEVITDIKKDTTVIDLDDLIKDEDGDKLTYTVVSKDSALVIGKLDPENKLILELQPHKYGKTIVIVTADDGKGGITSDTIPVEVIETNAFTYDKRANFHVGHVINPAMFTVAIMPNPAPAGTTSMRFDLNHSEADQADIAIYSSVGTKTAESNVLFTNGKASFNWDFAQSRGTVESSSYLAIITFRANGTVLNQERKMIGVQK